MNTIETEIPDAPRIGVILAISTAHPITQVINPDRNRIGTVILGRLVGHVLHEVGVYVSGGMIGELNQAVGLFTVKDLGIGLRAIKSALELVSLDHSAGIVWWDQDELVWRDFHGAYSQSFQAKLEAADLAEQSWSETLMMFLPPTE
jgi:hypothetical protein